MVIDAPQTLTSLHMNTYQDLYFQQEGTRTSWCRFTDPGQRNTHINISLDRPLLLKPSPNSVATP